MKPVTITNTFAAQTGPIPLSQLDADFTALANVVNDLGTYSNYLTDTSGTANQINGAILAGTTVSYIVGLEVQVKVALATTSSSVNININGLGNKPVVNSDNTALLPGQIAAGQIIELVYDGTSFRIINPGAFLFVPLTVIQSVAPTTRTSTTTLTNDANLQFAIPVAGTYEVEVLCFVNGGGAGGIQYNLNYSGTIGNGGNAIVATSQWPIGTVGTVGGGALLSNVVNAAAFQYNAGGTLNSTFQVKCVFQATTTGTIAFAWSQNASNATALTLSAGSSMVVRRVG